MFVGFTLLLHFCIDMILYFAGSCNVPRPESSVSLIFITNFLLLLKQTRCWSTCRFVFPNQPQIAHLPICFSLCPVCCVCCELACTITPERISLTFPPGDPVHCLLWRLKKKINKKTTISTKLCKWPVRERRENTRPSLCVLPFSS